MRSLSQEEFIYPPRHVPYLVGNSESSTASNKGRIRLLTYPPIAPVRGNTGPGNTDNLLNMPFTAVFKVDGPRSNVEVYILYYIYTTYPYVCI